mmetsp:Transcript_6130/g.15661  ORF Transcript_6130/g.15661 Transcript_6130/m.15661 type:complete len:270 (+) Transcript_6130:459-1268(+)
MMGTYCLAEAELSRFYTKAGFQRFQWDPERRTLPLPSKVRDQFARMKGKKHQVDMECFVWQPIRVLLLQHQNEIHRNGTNTGQLLLNTRHLNVIQQTWSGRADNEEVERTIGNSGECVLLWTGGRQTVSSIIAPDSGIGRNRVRTGALPTFVLLDGTWQEAQRMYRKLAFVLAPMPTLTLVQPKESQYRLRKNYGWRNRFKSRPQNIVDGVGSTTSTNDGQDLFQDDGVGGDLMCTVEVVAELLDRLDLNAGAHLLRRRLKTFQSDEIL